MTRTIQLLGRIDADHRLTAQVPEDVPTGPVKLAIVVEENATDVKTEDIASSQWTAGISREWEADLADSRQDIYTLDDGGPVDETV